MVNVWVGLAAITVVAAGCTSARVFVGDDAASTRDAAAADSSIPFGDVAPPPDAPPVDVLWPDAPPPPDLGPDTFDPKTYVVGCSDGTREGFVDLKTYEKIAGCAGGWSIPGLLRVLLPRCSRKGGNSSRNPTGTGCVAADLCAHGWTVCLNSIEVNQKSSTGCKGAVPSTAGQQFFASRQSSTGCGVCATGTSKDARCTSSSCRGGCLQTVKISNDIFGCGSYGAIPAAGCAPFDRFSQNLCSSLGSPWSCGRDGYQEAHNVVKSSSSKGGVMCCRD